MTKQSKAEMDGDGRVRDALTSIGAHARSANLARAAQLADALRSLEADTLSGTQRDTAVRSAHQLAGSAGTFGQQPASRLASWFERFFTGTASADAKELGHARRQLDELQRSLEEPPDLD